MTQMGARDPGAERAMPQGAAERMVERIGRLTRMLHDSLRDLGYDRDIERTAAAIPDARDRLDYVAAMSEQAARRALDAVEEAMPLQERLAKEARALAVQWAQVRVAPELTALVEATHRYLEAVPTQVDQTRAWLREIMMAQDFQDLTGQVIRRVTEIVRDAERQLLALLIEHPPSRARAGSLLEGPVIKPEARADVLKNQSEVDTLLAEFGF